MIWYQPSTVQNKQKIKRTSTKNPPLSNFTNNTYNNIFYLYFPSFECIVHVSYRNNITTVISYIIVVKIHPLFYAHGALFYNDNFMGNRKNGKTKIMSLYTIHNHRYVCFILFFFLNCLYEFDLIKFHSPSQKIK